MKPARRTYRLYMAPLIMIVGCMAVVLSANIVFLGRVGELTPLDDIIALQRAALEGRGSGALVNRLHKRYQYAKKLYDVHRPEIVITGSSRAMKMSASFTTRPLLNLGGFVTSPKDLFQLTDALFTDHQPRVIVHMADWWGFTSPDPSFHVWMKLPLPRPRPDNNPWISPVQTPLLIPLDLLRDYKLSLKRYAEIVLGTWRPPDRGLPVFGFGAVAGNSGHAFDGSQYVYGIFRPPPSPEERKAGTQKRFINKIRYRVARNLLQRRIDLYKRFVDEMEGRGITVITVAPPVAPTVSRWMKDLPDYRAVPAWLEAMAKTVPNFFDFHDPLSIGSPDSEFIDDYHGGEVADLRIFERLASALEPLLGDQADITRMIGRINDNSGKWVFADDGVGALLMRAGQ